MALIFQNLANIRVRTDDNGDLIVSPSASGSTFLAVSGTSAAPGFAFVSQPGLGFYRSSANHITLANDGAIGGIPIDFAQSISIGSPGSLNWSSTTSALGAGDVVLGRGGAAQLVFNGSAGGVTTTTTFVKATSAIADATGTPTITVSIPNGAVSGSVKVTLAGSLGAGGAVGANEASGTVAYDIAVTRTAGVNATAIISAAYGSAMTNEAGAATITVTAALSAISGAVGAVNTFTVNVTITKGGGASANHTCVTSALLINANASGITLS
jgi:hypothetical protein